MRKHVLIVMAVLSSMATTGLAGDYTMTHPNTVIYPTQCTGTGNRKSGVTVTFQIRHPNGENVKAGVYGFPYGGWLVPLTYADTGVGVSLEVRLLAEGAEQINKSVTTGSPEN